MAYANQLARCSSYSTNNSDERIANEWKKKNKALLKTAQQMIEGQGIQNFKEKKSLLEFNY